MPEPVASQEAEAREAYESAYSSYIDTEITGRHYCTSRDCSVWAEGRTKDEKWEALIAVIRASEREKYAALVEALRTISHHANLASPTLPLRPSWVIEVCASALAALEEAKSA